MITSEKLIEDLKQFYGTEHYWSLGFPTEIYLTDGVKYFAEEAEAFWLMTELALEYHKLQKLDEYIFVTVDNKIKVDKDGYEKRVAKTIFTDGNDKIYSTRHYENLDLPLGIWKFYIMYNVILLPSEY
jgi:hypothetical protein